MIAVGPLHQYSHHTTMKAVIGVCQLMFLHICAQANHTVPKILSAAGIRAIRVAHSECTFLSAAGIGRANPAILQINAIQEGRDASPTAHKPRSLELSRAKSQFPDRLRQLSPLVARVEGAIASARLCQVPRSFTSNLRSLATGSCVDTEIISPVTM